MFTRIEHAWNKNCAKKVEAAKVTESCRDTFYCLYSGFVRCSFALSSFLTRESKEIYLQNLNNKRGMLNTRVGSKNISKRFYEERNEKCIFAYFIFFIFEYRHARFHSINLRVIRKVLMNIHGGPLRLSCASFTWGGGETKRYFLESSLKLCRIFFQLDKIRTSRKIFVNLN